MTTNLLESIAEQLTPNMAQRVSTLMGETPAHTQKALDGAILTLLAGLMHLSSLGDGPTRLVDLINHRNYGRLLNNLSGLLGEGKTAQTFIASGQDILRTLFTDKRSAVSALIADASGVTHASASSLLSLTAPVVVGVIGRVRTAQGLSAEGLTTLLIARKDDISRQAPAGLASVFGLSNIAELGASRADTATGTAPNGKTLTAWEQRGKDSGRPPWGGLLLGIAALSVVYWMWGGETGETPLRTSTPPHISARALEGLPPIPPGGRPDGAALSLTKGSFTSPLTTFLGDPSATTVPKPFVLDHVSFASGTTTLTTESEQTVKELSAILAAYPATEVQLNGYTDNVGDAASNKKLSLDRAEAVKAALISDGIGAVRLATAGYGQEHPLASNDTEDGRATNRRLELVVLKK